MPEETKIQQCLSRVRFESKRPVELLRRRWGGRTLQQQLEKLLSQRVVLGLDCAGKPAALYVLRGAQSLASNYKPGEEELPASITEELGQDIWRAGGENVDVSHPADNLSGVLLHQRQIIGHLDKNICS